QRCDPIQNDASRHVCGLQLLVISLCEQFCLRPSAAQGELYSELLSAPMQVAEIEVDHIPTNNEIRIYRLEPGAKGRNSLRLAVVERDLSGYMAERWSFELSDQKYTSLFTWL